MYDLMRTKQKASYTVAIFINILIVKRNKF